MMAKKSKLLYTDSDWNFELLEKTWSVIADIGRNHLGLDFYDAQIEVISSDQMLDAYSSSAMPILYGHWSFGKSFIQNEKDYKEGKQGLAYEVVINTNPSIAYCMENNSMTMQTLVMAHASVGHSSFFKNNYLFRNWTDASSILSYLKFAKNYIEECEKKYGYDEVEVLLDACHALEHHGIDKYKKPKISEELLSKKFQLRQEIEDSNYSEIWSRTIPTKKRKQENHSIGKFTLPEENLLYFIEKNSPILEDWQREIIRIVRNISQYFYPQMQTQLMNEGWATFVHYEIMTELFDRGHISEGNYIEFLTSHSGVIYQPDWKNKYYSGINVYALGFAMMQDIKRICTNPDEEDKKWFPDICNTDWKTTMKNIVANYRDESFVLQFLSPKVIRDFKLFVIDSDETKKYHEVIETHDDEDVLRVRAALSEHYDISKKIPVIEIVDCDLMTNELYVNFVSTNGQLLDFDDADSTGAYLSGLWGYPTYLSYVDINGKQLDRVK